MPHPIVVLVSRHALALTALFSWAVLAVSLGLQWGLDLVPCPMCIVQRYCLISLALTASLAWILRRPFPAYIAIVAAGLGAFTAGRQSLLQWNPPEFASCGRDFYGMVEAFPLSKLIPAIFAGSGDCASSTDSVLGITFANASFVFFVMAIVALARYLQVRRIAL